MAIRDEIELIANEMGLVFRYGRNTDENISGDNEPYPAMVLIEPDQFQISINQVSGNLFDSDTVFIRFITLHEMTQSAEDRKADIQSMRDLARDFINRAANSESITIGATVRGVPVIDSYDANVVGVEIQCQISLINPSQSCF